MKAAMRVKAVQVCQGDACVAQGSAALLQDIEDLCEELEGFVEVVPCSCLKLCQSAPALQLVKSGNETVKYPDVTSFDALENLFKEEFGDQATAVFRNATRNKGRQMKFILRREEDITKRNELLDRMISSLQADSQKDGGSTPSSQPDNRLVSELLVLRARHRLNTPDTKESDYKEAMADAKRALQLTPDCYEAYLLSADVSEINSDISAAAETLQKALSVMTPTSHHNVSVQKQVAVAWHRADLLATDYASWSVQNVELVSLPASSVEYRLLTLKALEVGSVAEHTFPSDIWHVRVRARPQLGRMAQTRPYTPVSTQDEYREGLLRLLVKVKPRGLLSRHLASLEVNTSLSISPPQCTVPMPACEPGLICVVGGSAMTVGVQLAEAALRKHGGVPIRLVNCMDNVADLVLEERLQELVKSSHVQVVHYVASGASDKKTVSSNRVYWRDGLITLSGLSMGVNAKVAVSGPPALHEAVLGLMPEAHISEANYISLDDVVPQGMQSLRRRAAADKPSNGNTSQGKGTLMKWCCLARRADKADG